VNSRVILAIIVFSFAVFYSAMKFRAGKAAILCIVWGWLFMPEFNYVIEALPDLSKIVVVGGITAAILFFVHSGKFLRLRYSIHDIPIALWCFCPFISSLVNGFGPYDAVSTSLERFLEYGPAYIMGRALILNQEDRTELLRTIVFAAICYIPLCWFEMRFSPQFHTWVYGYHPHDFAQSVRNFGWRPVVFFKHGLPLAIFLCSASLILTRASVDKIYLFTKKKITGQLGALALILTTIATQSQYAIALLLMCLFWILSGLSINSAFSFLLCLLPALFVILRVSGAMTGDWIVNELENFRVDDSRVKSVAFRYSQENVSLDFHWENPLFGHHSWDNRPKAGSFGDWNYVYDSSWIIAFGTNGILGLIAIMMVYIWPVIHWAMADKSRINKTDKVFLGACIICFTVVSYDNLLNDLRTPIGYLLLGAYNSFWTTHKNA
jgi:hypothetical protein